MDKTLELNYLIFQQNRVTLVSRVNTDIACLDTINYEYFQCNVIMRSRPNNEAIRTVVVTVEIKNTKLNLHDANHFELKCVNISVN